MDIGEILKIILVVLLIITACGLWCLFVKD